MVELREALTDALHARNEAIIGGERAGYERGVRSAAEVADSFASPERPDRWTALGEGGAVSWFRSEAEAIDAGKRVFRDRFVRAVNNGPRELWCCEESAAEFRDRILALLTPAAGGNEAKGSE